MRYILTVCTLSSALVMVAAHRTAAQQDVPRELALALIPFGATEGGEIIIGQMPPDLAAAFTLPPGARVLGSFVSLAYAQAVLTIPGKTDSALALARRSLSEHGWVARNPMRTSMGGLQFTPGGSSPGIFCKPGEPASLNISESVSKTWSKEIGSRGTQEITITVTRMPTQTGCYDVNLRATGLAR